MFEDVKYDLDESYDPYEETQYLSKCSRGYFISENRFCCNVCYLEESYRLKNRPSLEGYINEQYNYVFIDEPLKPINIDWETLNLQPPKTNKEIKKQYYKLALKLHPDKKGGNHNLFTKLNNSYNNLLSI